MNSLHKKSVPWIRAFIILVLLFFSGSVPALSQGLIAGYFIRPQYNSMGSVNTRASNITINSNQTYTFYNGIELGYLFTKSSGISTCISYGTDGQKFIYENRVSNQLTERSAHHYRFNMLKVPIQFKFKGNAGKIAFMVEGGPQICFLVKAGNKSDWGNFNYTEDYSRFQFGFRISTGIGYQYNDHLLFYVTPQSDLTALDFHYTTANLANTYPLGRRLTSQNVGLQFGFLWSR